MFAENIQMKPNKNDYCLHTDFKIRHIGKSWWKIVRLDTFKFTLISIRALSLRFWLLWFDDIAVNAMFLLFVMESMSELNRNQITTLLYRLFGLFICYQCKCSFVIFNDRFDLISDVVLIIIMIFMSVIYRFAFGYAMKWLPYMDSLIMI